jgi:CDP-diacylglycerol--glycerol-3-phosphate 3-phosphatidyltransferase
MIKYLPNILSICRIILALAIIFTKPLSTLFFILYFSAGISDVFDGYIARKTNNTSGVGATLDSIADFIFIAVMLCILLQIIRIPLWMVIWIAGIAIIRGLSLIIGFIKFHSIAFLHTYANKATGLLLFCFPAILVLTGLTATGILLCTVASISAIEDLAINIRSKELIKDVISIFRIKVN